MGEGVYSICDIPFCMKELSNILLIPLKISLLKIKSSFIQLVSSLVSPLILIVFLESTLIEYNRKPRGNKEFCNSVRELMNSIRELSNSF